MAKRKLLQLHNLFDKSAERLRQRHHHIALMERLPADGDRSGQTVYGNPMLIQEVDQSDQFAPVLLRQRHNIVIRGLRFSLLNLFFTHPVAETQNLFAITGCGFDDGKSRYPLVLDNICQPPPAACPGFWHVDAFFVFRQTFAPHPQFIGLDIDGFRHIGTGAFGQNPDYIFPDAGFGGTGPIIVEQIVLGHTGQTIRGHVFQHIDAK